MSIVSNRRGRANNEHIENYNAQEESKYIAYFDINNLYGWSQCQSMPYSDFKWVEAASYVLPSYAELCSNTLNKGHILEVGLEYPKELHDVHNELPYCPEKVK